MRDYHINIFHSDDDEGYIADIPDMEACSAFGETPDEVLYEVQKAKDLWIKTARAEGKPVPHHLSLTCTMRYRMLLNSNGTICSSFFAGRSYRNRKLTYIDDFEGNDIFELYGEIYLEQVYPLPKNYKLYYHLDFGDD